LAHNFHAQVFELPVPEHEPRLQVQRVGAIGRMQKSVDVAGSRPGLNALEVTKINATRVPAPPVPSRDLKVRVVQFGSAKPQRLIWKVHLGGYKRGGVGRRHDGGINATKRARTSQSQNAQRKRSELNRERAFAGPSERAASNARTGHYDTDSQIRRTVGTLDVAAKEHCSTDIRNRSVIEGCL